MLKLALPFALVFTLAACSEPSAPPAPAAAPEPAPAEPSPAAEATPAATHTLVSLEQGDHACYVNVRDAAGAESSLPGSFELCPGGGSDATALVGQTVTLEQRRENMAADSCQGDPECTDTKEVELVVGVAAAR